MSDTSIIADVLPHLAGAAPVVWAAVRGLGKVVAKVEIIESRLEKMDSDLSRILDLKHEVADLRSDLNEVKSQIKREAEERARISGRLDGMEAAQP